MSMNDLKPGKEGSETREVPIVEEDFTKLLTKFKIKFDLAANIAVNIAGALSTFLISTWESQRLTT